MQTPNKYGLFDAPIRSSEKERIVLSEEELKRHLEGEGFTLPREEAICLGFINPYDEQDTVVITIEVRT